jgi:hypothetical protein
VPILEPFIRAEEAAQERRAEAYRRACEDRKRELGISRPLLTVIDGGAN